MTAPTEPLKLTLDELFAFLGEREYSLTLAGGVYFALPPEHSPAMHGEGATPWEAASAAFPRCKFVARDDAAELRAALDDAAAFLKRIDDWEGSVVLADEVWATSDGMPKLTRELYDQWIELQDERNRLRAALAASEGQP